MHRKVVAALVLVSFSSACATSKHIVINTEPQGARIRIDGQPIGESPTRFEDRFGSSNRTYMLEASKDGYKKSTQIISQSTDSGCVLGSVIGGLIFIIPFIGLAWCSQLPQTQYFISLDADPTAPASLPTSNAVPNT